MLVPEQRKYAFPHESILYKINPPNFWTSGGIFGEIPGVLPWEEFLAHPSLKMPCSPTRPTRNDKITSTGNHLETYRKSEILNASFLAIFRLKYQEDILLEQEDVPIGCGEHQSLVTGNLQDINFTISLGFPNTWLRLVGLLR